MISLKRKQSGFTIVELLIVIVVIGILAALVVTTFSGIQKKGRDSERRTDIGAVHSQIEAYHATNGRYPTNTDLDTDSFVQANMKGLDLNALADPKGANNDLAAAPTVNVYSYAELPTGCDSDPSAVNPDCISYTLTSILEDGGAQYAKTSLN